jgi:hypothetical protein
LENGRGGGSQRTLFETLGTPGRLPTRHLSECPFSVQVDCRWLLRIRLLFDGRSVNWIVRQIALDVIAVSEFRIVVGERHLDRAFELIDLVRAEQGQVGVLD